PTSFYPSGSSTLNERNMGAIPLLASPQGGEYRLIGIGSQLHTAALADSLPFLVRRFRFDNTGPAKNGGDHRIAFVAGPLVDWPFCFRPGNLRGPSFGPRGGIFNRKLVSHRVIRGAREAFHQMQLFAGSSERGQVGEIGGVDYQRVPLPMPHRVSLPQANVLLDMRAAVGGDDAREVTLLAKQGHVSRPLHNL